MGFETGNDRGNGSNGNSNATREANKAHGFINIYLPGENGKRKKLGTIQLRVGNVNEMALSKWLSGEGKQPQQDLEEVQGYRLDKLLESVEFDYNSAEASAGNGFALLQD